MLETCFSTAPSVTTSSRAMPLLERPSAISESTSRSRGVSSSRRAGPRPGDELRDDLGVHRRPAGRDAPHGLDELGGIGDAVLQQVADAAAAVREQLLGEDALDVLREDEHRQAVEPLARGERAADALVAERRRQAHVDDADVGPLALDGLEERVGVLDRGDDLAAVVLEQAREAVAQQREVLGDHDAHGSSARRIVGPPAGLDRNSVPSSASTRLRRPVSPLPSGFAPPRPSSRTSTSSRVAAPLDAHGRGLRLGVLGDVRERLADDEVGGGLDGRRAPRR